MKILIGGLAAMFLTAAAVAQPAPAPAPDPMTPNAPVVAPTPAPETTPAPAAVPNLIEKDGKWWNGDRVATKEEIAEYKRSRPQ